ncbi:hypothetical protein BV898_13308 [Hypsibius exemplaris]|uniref:G-protein coupled receptors family 1 profile domain-containing protein n=1 Tax=Hypsibius exemplaris TaxID=2072580 RepID=A0A1W0WB93_HYPEX|nr:hypothetical protein BV898_13308 [Hypsibius exemplaris]
MAEISQRNLSLHNASRIKAPLGSNATAIRLSHELYIASWAGVGITSLACVLNLAILVVFYRGPRRLINPFSIHVINMTIINLLYAAINDPFALANLLHREAYYGNKYFCGAYNFFQWTLQISMPGHQQLIICFDRWLALLVPVWYRTKTVKFGMTATLISLAYTLAWYLPIFITDITYTETMVIAYPMRYCTYIKTLMGYQLVARFALTYVPRTLLVVLTPGLLYMVWKRRRKVLSTIAPSFTNSLVSNTASGNIRMASLVRNRRPPVQRNLKAERERRFRAELWLVLWLMGMQIGCWISTTVPSVLMQQYVGVAVQEYIDSYSFALILSMLLLIAEPIAYVVFLKDLRAEIRSYFRCFR